MKSKASSCQFNGKVLVWTFTIPILNRLVGINRIAPAPHILALSVFPAIDVAFVRIGNTDSEAVNFSGASDGQVEQILMAVV